jgi:hypothetical protein
VRIELEQMAVAGENTAPKMAYFISAQDVHAGKFIGSAQGVGSTDLVSDECYMQALRIRLLAPQHTRGGQVATQCLGCMRTEVITPGGATRSIFEDNWAHAAGCTAGTTGPFTSRHNQIAWELETLLRGVARAQKKEVLVEREKSCRLPGGEQGAAAEGRALAGYSPRIDVYVQWESGKQCYIDVAIADPGCKAYLAKGSDVRANAAAEAREKDKFSSFKTDFRGIPWTEFVPFVVEATGRVGPAASKYLRSLDAPPDMLRRFFERVSLLCAKNLGRLALHSQGVRR